MSEVNDDVLQSCIERAQRGERDALGELFDIYHERIYRYAYVLLGSVSDAQEATGETFAQMVRSIRSYTWRGPTFTAWLFRIARNVATDEMRRRSRRGELRDLSTGIDRTIPTPEEVVVDRDSGARVRAMLSDLPEEQRRVLELRFVAGLPPEEIAHILGKSAGAVRVQQVRALESLRKRAKVVGL